MGALRTFQLKKPARPETAEQASMALPEIIGCLDPSKECRVLDLGQAYGSNVEFYSTFSKKIYIEDLQHSSLPELGPDKLKDELLPYGDHVRFDVILCWDLINYMDRQEVKLLGEHLARFCHPGSVLFLMVSILPRMSARPGGYKVLEPHRLAYCPGNETRECPRYTKSDLRTLLPRFERQRSFLMRNGMEEQILIFKGG